MNVRFFFAAALFAVLGLSAGSATAQAQSTFTVTYDRTSVELPPNGGTTIVIIVRNISNDPINASVSRTKNNLPSGGWSTALCTGELCYSYDVDNPAPVKIAPGDSMIVDLNVSSDSVGGTAVIGLRFTAGLGSGVISQDFTASVISAGIESPNAVAGIAAYPNPAKSLLTIPTGSMATNGATLQLFNSRGEMIASDIHVATSTNGIVADVSALPNGAYFYRVIAGTKHMAGSVVVSH